MRRTSLEALALALTTSLCGWLLLETTRLQSEAIETAPIVATTGTAEVQYPATSTRDVTHRPLSAYAATIARPVFFEGRKVPQPEEKLPQSLRKAQPPDLQPPPPPPPKAAPLPNSARLLGVVRQSGADRALIEAPPAHSAAWMMVGDRIGDWTVSEIQDTRATFKSVIGTVSLDLYPEATPR